METNTKVVLIIHGPSSVYKSSILSDLMNDHFPEFKFIDPVSTEEEIIEALTGNMIIDAVDDMYDNMAGFHAYIDWAGEPVIEDVDHISVVTNHTLKGCTSAVGFIIAKIITWGRYHKLFAYLD